MAIWCLSKTIACGTAIATAALIYYITILHNRRDKKEMDKADNNKTFEIKIINTSSPNVHNERHSFGKNSTSQSNMPVLSKVRQVVSPLSKQSTSNNPIKPPRSKRLYQIQSKAVEYYNSIMQNSPR
ncbi:uncharacterized protein LOC112467297 [Temnothorax curvispinosus]|uniref:Uncharacterized protein LOC112467297 n=1 Tax=Temnothorax curvispinosus TaxID=300111 RepID=A0A6J1R9B5_9HYME|nr:uncharacterized protein LOC112467297 [Temnothorax curvispinosus]